MKTLYDVLKSHFGTQSRIANRFSVSRQAVSRWDANGVPENIALRCHLDPEIPYIYQPSDYGIDGKGLVLTKPTKPTTKPNDEVTTNDDTIYLQAS